MEKFNGNGAFQFENENGVLLRLFKGTQKIGIEISNQILGIHSAMKWSKKLGQKEAKKYFKPCVRILEYRVAV